MTFLCHKITIFFHCRNFFCAFPSLRACEAIQKPDVHLDCFVPRNDGKQDSSMTGGKILLFFGEVLPEAYGHVFFVQAGVDAFFDSQRFEIAFP